MKNFSTIVRKLIKLFSNRKIIKEKKKFQGTEHEHRECSRKISRVFNDDEIIILRKRKKL